MPIEINDQGTGNICRINPNTFDDGAELTIRGNDNVIEIAAEVDMRTPRIHVQGDGNTIRFGFGPTGVPDPAEEISGPFLLHTDTRAAEMAVLGNGNTVEACRYTELYDSKIQVVGHDNLMRLGHGVRAHMQVDFHTDGGVFEVGDRTTAVAMQAALAEPRTLRLGKDCQLAAAIYITVSDTHSIVDAETGERINYGEDVEIGDHVWLGYRVIVLKGARIGSGSIIGTSGVVTGEIPENCCAVGNPARVVREGVTWTRELIGPPDVEAVG